MDIAVFVFTTIAIGGVFYEGMTLKWYDIVGIFVICMDYSFMPTTMLHLIVDRKDKWYDMTPHDKNIMVNPTWSNFAMQLAKHFFELGLKKGQKNIWHTMDETPNYPCDILFLTNVDNMFLYRYMENGRPVDMETPYFYNILNGKCWCYINDLLPKSE